MRPGCLAGSAPLTEGGLGRVPVRAKAAADLRMEGGAGRCLQPALELAPSEDLRGIPEGQGPMTFRLLIATGFTPILSPVADLLIQEKAP